MEDQVDWQKKNMPNLNNDGSNTDINNNFDNGLEDDKNSLEKKTSIRNTSSHQSSQPPRHQRGHHPKEQLCQDA